MRARIATMTSRSSSSRTTSCRAVFSTWFSMTARSFWGAFYVHAVQNEINETGSSPWYYTFDCRLSALVSP
jgi:hypothetical protein